MKKWLAAVVTGLIIIFAAAQMSTNYIAWPEHPDPTSAKETL